MRRMIGRPGYVGALWVAAACGGGGPTSPPPPPGGSAVASLELAPKEATLTEIGATTRFTAIARDASGRELGGTPVSFGTSDPTVLTVDGQGTATARGSGGARVSASAGGVRAVAAVAVRAGPLEWVDVRAGLVHSCGVTSHGTAYCWGDNTHGEIGNGDVAQFVPEPTAVEGGTLYFEAFTLGGGHTCALASGAEAYCWGNTFFGEGGFGEETDVWTDPTRVQGAHEFDELAAGGSHTCGLTVAGVALCWGVNDRGQLGDESLVNRSVPVPVSGELAFAQISAASMGIDNHTCGVTTSGEAYCWGVNAAGELGDGTTVSRSSPVEVGGGLAFAMVTTGGEHSCGLTGGGEAYCWGANQSGQLGDGTRQARLQPTPVAGGIPFAWLTAGESFTCGVSTTGDGYCWGNNASGQLGHGSTQGRLLPSAISGGIDWARLDAGQNHVCGVGTDATAYCWGSNVLRKLGHQSPMEQHVPVALPDPGDLD